MSYRVDISKTSPEILRGLINFDNNTDFTEDTLLFHEGGPARLNPWEVAENHRTDAIYCKFIGYYIDWELFYYNRIPLEQFFGSHTAAAPMGSVKYTSELLPCIRRDLGINIGRGDIVEEWIDPDALFVDVKVKNENLSYVGTLRVFFTGHPSSLMARVPNTKLRGFTKDHIQGVTNV